ncbi:hypothetical protein DENSPDRAFT_834503 [Dentipellis sp. KUC8613]|nr:hypothetical protein DENSPDRAFT_834503 [Dentipellis sp. KUC8613]
MQTARGYTRGAPLNGRIQTTMQVADVPRAVASLLETTKQLQEMLRLWGNRAVNENQVSDVYVRVGTEFNATVTAFAQFNIDLSDLYSIPQELRSVLENCLSEDASPAVLDIYMPQIRQIIYNLLQGLRNKQAAYRSAVSANQSYGR